MDAKMTHYPAFLATLKAKPHLYPTIRRVALQLIADGYIGMSMYYVLNTIRFNPRVAKVGRLETEDYSLNNSQSAYFLRLFLHEFPEHRHLFDLRKSEADHVSPAEWDQILGKSGVQMELNLFS